MGGGIHHLYVETHSWAESLVFWAAMGFELEPGWQSGDGILRPPSGPYVFLRLVPEAQPLALQVYLTAGDLHEVVRNAVVDVERGPYQADWGPRLLDIKDPDGRSFVVRANEEL